MESKASDEIIVGIAERNGTTLTHPFGA